MTPFLPSPVIPFELPENRHPVWIGADLPGPASSGRSTVELSPPGLINLITNCNYCILMRNQASPEIAELCRGSAHFVLR